MRHTRLKAVLQIQRVSCVLERIGRAGRGQGAFWAQIHPRERPTPWEPLEAARWQSPTVLDREKPNQQRSNQAARTGHGAIRACEAIGSVLLRFHDEDGIGWPPE
jgi:hypothetical protein